MPTAAFVDQCMAKYASPRIVFTHDGTDYSAYVLDVSEIRRDSTLTAGRAVVTLYNGTGTFNDFMSDVYAIYKTVVIALTFSGLGENLNLFTGQVEAVRFEGELVVLTCRDYISKCLEKTIGSGQEVIDFTEDPLLNSELVWQLLTDYAVLDSVESTDNTDIDYDAFTTWGTSIDAKFDLKARFTGMSVRNALLKIADLTESVFWVNGAGKVDFGATDVLGDNRAYSQDYVLDKNLDVTFDGRVNDYKVNYGFDPDTDQWDGETGLLIWGYGPFEYLQELVEEDRNVWHVSKVSADYCANEKLDRVGYQIRRWTIKTALLGYCEDICEIITLTNFYSAPLDSIAITLDEVNYNLNDFTATLSGYWLWGY